MMGSVKTFNRRWKMAVAAFAASAALWPVGARAQMASTAQPTPGVGDKARDFALQSLDGATVRLSEELVRGPLVLVVLRGWPGYQCPFCTRQFGDYRLNAQKFAERGAPVIFVYPGPSAGLRARAEAFTANGTVRQLSDPARSRLFVHSDVWAALGCAERNRVSVNIRARQEWRRRIRAGQSRSRRPRSS